jgi:hypothetical protein
MVRVSQFTWEEGAMYVTEVVWWGYVAFVAILALFFLLFASRVREKGE